MTPIVKESLIKKGVPLASSIQKQLIKIQGTLTSSIQLRGEEPQEPYYYSFIRLKRQKIDLPVIFKTKENDQLTKPNLKKSDEVELTGHYSNSEKSVRKSFTATSYQLLSEKRIRKKCSGCLDIFTCSPAKNYDYCSKCELNGSRYLNKDSPCSECDGSGLIKFKGQPLRCCKLCYLPKQEKPAPKYLAK
ncbi:3663_t:CDS:1 [Funneliformis caledonium]|uniref:3663_t:CDS:1 n=1 Tax=Funneliformis caledonium TaxID=1117310 RepID=A0A9N9DBX0_9GLOM|nr:3663_t:CDS:1 [Funneliformis caledonium]